MACSRHPQCPQLLQQNIDEMEGLLWQFIIVERNHKENFQGFYMLKSWSIWAATLPMLGPGPHLHASWHLRAATSVT